jgi:prepilin-type N-terminal cleavage/methylation domain-containing protein
VKSGYSVLEVLIVVVILGVLASVTIPHLGSHLDEIKLNSILLESEAAVILAKNYSQALSEPVGVSFNITNDSIVGFQIVNLSASEDNKVIETIVVDPVISVTLNSQIGQVIFNPTSSIRIKDRSGEDFPPQDCVIRFSDSDQVTGDVVIFEHSGAVQVFRDF